MMDFNSAKTILLFYDTSLNQDDVKLISEFAQELKQEKKEVYFLIYHPTKKVAPFVHTGTFDTHVCKSDYNILKQPSSSLIKRQIKLEYDIFICFSTLNDKRVSNTIKKSKSKFKVGMSQFFTPQICNAILMPKEEANIESYLHMLGRFLQQIQTI
jgi:hypothetical protein